MPVNDKNLLISKQRGICFIYAGSLFLFLLIIPTFSGSAAAQNKRTKSTTGKSSLPASKCSSDDNSKIIQIRSFVEKVKSYQTKSVRGRSVIDLNALLWECDEDFARSSFLSFWQDINNEIENAGIKQKNTATNTPEENRNLNRMISTDKFLQQYLIAKLKGLDKTLAAQLSKKLTSEEKGFADFLSVEGSFDAGNLSRQQLIQFRQILRSNPISRTVPFLFDLKSQNPQIADQLFLELLAFSQNNSGLTFDDLMLLGTYLYTSRIYINADWNNSYSYNTLPARGVGLLIDLTVERSNTNKSLRVSYLRLVAGFTLNPVPEALEKTRRYVFGRIMLGHISQDDPEFVNLMVQALQMHSGGVPDNFKDDGFYASFQKINDPSEPDTYESNLEDLEKTVGSDERDDKAARLAGALYTKGQYERIEKITDYISDTDKKNSISDVSRYALATRLIESGKLDEAETVLKKINGLSFKALIGLRLVQELKAAKTSGFGRADQFIYEVAGYAKKSDDEYAPVILLALAKLVYEKDEGFGYELISTAVKKLNANESWDNPKWRIDIPTPSIGIPSITFFMKKVPGLGISESLSPLIKESKTNLEEVAFSIKNEKIQAEAFRLLAGQYLAEVKKKSAKIEKNAN
jgi:hypothetical protein